MEEEFEFLAFNGNVSYRVLYISEARLLLSKLCLNQRYKDLENSISHKDNQEALIRMYGDIPNFKLKSYLADELLKHAHPLTVAKLRLLGIL